MIRVRRHLDNLPLCVIFPPCNSITRRRPPLAFFSLHRRHAAVAALALYNHNVKWVTVAPHGQTSNRQEFELQVFFCFLARRMLRKRWKLAWRPPRSIVAATSVQKQKEEGSFPPFPAVFSPILEPFHGAGLLNLSFVGLERPGLILWCHSS